MLKDFFEIEKNNSTIKTEIIAGITTFLSAMYIIVVNPAILQNTGMPFNGVLTATIIVSSLCTIMMGLYAKNPLLVAPGMGLNTFFTFSVVIGMGEKWEVALGSVFWSGIIFLLLSIFNIRTQIVKSIPKQLRYAVSAGIGLFIALIGFVNASFIVSNPSTILGISKMNPVFVTFVAGLFFTGFLSVRKVKGAMIIGIIFTTLISIPIGRLYGDASAFSEGAATLVTWKGILSKPDFSLFIKMNLIDSLKFAVWPTTFAFLFTDMFDSLSTFIGVAEAANLIDKNGEPRNVKESLIVDAVATTIAGIFGSSPGTAYIESAAGIEEGGRTGLTALIAGLLFLPFIFFSPLLSVVPAIATSPVLIIVGVFMTKPILKINWDKLDDAIPAFLALIIIPFTYSITQGIIWGFLSWTFIKILVGKSNEVSLALIIIDLFSILALIY